MRGMEFAFVPLKAEAGAIYLDNPLRKGISRMAGEIRQLIADDGVELARLIKPVIELGQEAIYAAAAEAQDEASGTVWQIGAMALTEPGQLGKELQGAQEVIDHWAVMGDKVESLRERWVGQAPSERELVHLIFSMVELAETASWGLSPAELARIGGMGMYVAGYLGLRYGFAQAGVAFAVLAAMDELELFNVEAGTAAVQQLRQHGLDVGLGAAMPFLL